MTTHNADAEKAFMDKESVTTPVEPELTGDIEAQDFYKEAAGKHPHNHYSSRAPWSGPSSNSYAPKVCQVSYLMSDFGPCPSANDAPTPKPYSVSHAGCAPVFWELTTVSSI